MTITARLHLNRKDFSLNTDLTIPSRGITAIFGPSGCGKTSLLRALAGLERDCQGFLSVGGVVWQNQGYFLPPHKRPVGFVFQEPSLFAHLSVRGNLAYGLKRSCDQTHRGCYDQAIRILGIGPLMERGAHELSGGEQRRVAIARALAVSPTLLLLDEPLSGLDEKIKQEILPYLESLHRELSIPILYVSHSRYEVMRLADHLVLLAAGRVTASGPVAEVFSRLDLAGLQGQEASVVITTTVQGHDSAFALTHLKFSGGYFTIAQNHLAVGSLARIQVLARDVSITLDHQRGTSVLNILPATVTTMVPAGATHTMVQVMVGDVSLLARITRKSAVDLGLKTGKKVFAQIKSVALLS